MTDQSEHPRIYPERTLECAQQAAGQRSGGLPVGEARLICALWTCPYQRACPRHVNFPAEPHHLSSEHAA